MKLPFDRPTTLSDSPPNFGEGLSSRLSPAPDWGGLRFRRQALYARLPRLGMSLDWRIRPPLSTARWEPSIFAKQPHAANGALVNRYYLRFLRIDVRQAPSFAAGTR
jgi:hypothetical protein